MHSPLYLDYPGADTLVIFIHGFMGSPRQFDALAASAHSRGYAVCAPLLPGHGASARDFANASAEQWLQQVYQVVKSHQDRYQNIYLLGHSMGGLLAIHAALEYRQQVQGLMLINCPLQLRGLSPHWFKVRCMQFFYPQSHPVRSCYLAVSGVPRRPSLAWHSIKPLAELKKLTAAGKNLLPQIRVPIKAVYSMADETVSMHGARVMASKIDTAYLEQIMLKDSLHSYFPPHEQAVLEQALFKLITNAG